MRPVIWDTLVSVLAMRFISVAETAIGEVGKSWEYASFPKISLVKNGSILSPIGTADSSAMSQRTDDAAKVNPNRL